MKYLSRRFISILLSFFFIAVSLIVYINFIKPTYAEIKADQGKLAAERQKNQEYKEVFGRLKAVLDELKKSSDLQNRISMTLPLNANAADSMNQITAVAIANGLTVAAIEIVEAPVIPAASVKPGTISLIKGIGVLRNNIRLSGSYAQVRAFLRGVESGVRLSSVRSVKIDKAIATANPDLFNIIVEIETYYQVN